jgi:putative ABC transport system ATP-binding protein
MQNPATGQSAERAAVPSPSAARSVGLRKVYGEGDTEVVALRGIDVAFEAGRFTAIMGPSGSGKSTLMHCMAGLDSASAGQVFIGDADLTRMKDNELTRLRRERMGFVFQAFNLVPTLTAEENITLPVDIAGGKVDRAWFDLVVGTVGLADRLTHRPSELSGGQQQRVACARAMVTRPAIIFADEPTGNLDSRSGAEVLGFLRRSVDEFGQTIVMVTHDAHAASYADRVVFLADGALVDELVDPDTNAILDLMKSFDQAPGAHGVLEAERAAGTRATGTPTAGTPATGDGLPAGPAADPATPGERA